MRRHLSLAVFALGFASAAVAEPRSVDLAQNLASAEAVVVGTVAAYTPEGLTLSDVLPAGAPTALRLVQGATPEDKPWGKALPDPLTAHWPAAGTKVLVLVGGDPGNPKGKDQVSVLAVEQGGDWRFFSPYMTGSTAMFRCVAPARVLKAIGPAEKSDPTLSWDGCLVPKKLIVPRVGGGTSLPTRGEVEPASKLPPLPKGASAQIPRHLPWARFAELRAIAGREFQFAGLTSAALTAWQKGEVKVPGEGNYAEGDFDGNGEADCALRVQLDEGSALLVASARSGKWVRRGLVKLPAGETLRTQGGRVWVGEAALVLDGGAPSLFADR